MEEYTARLLYGSFPPDGYPRFLLQTLLARNNFAPSQTTLIRANRSADQIPEVDALVAKVTAGNNESQDVAVSYALDHPLTLIKGPPGTGNLKNLIELVELLSNTGRKASVVVPSNSATEHNAKHGSKLWDGKGYEPKDIHWVRKASDEKITIASKAIHAKFTQPPCRLHILGLEDAPKDVTTFFKDKIVEQALSDPHALPLKARIMQELEEATQKSDSWVSTNLNSRFGALEDREFLILNRTPKLKVQYAAK
jgi:hypothetical protein